MSISDPEIRARNDEELMEQKRAPGALRGAHQIAKLDDCSRTIEREAQKRLAARGLVLGSARRGWIVIAAFGAAGLLIAGGAVLLTKPAYTANTQLFVATQSSGSVQELQQGNNFSQARVQSYVKTVGSPVVLQPVIDSLGLSVSAEDLAARVKASTDVNTVLIDIAVSEIGRASCRDRVL